jgi:hypothetical protein
VRNLKGLLVLVFLLLTLSASPAARNKPGHISATELLGSGGFVSGETVPPAGPFTLALTFRTVDPATGDTSFYCLFKGLMLNDSDVGRTFFVDETNDPAFLDAVRVLTNGRGDEMGITTGDPAISHPCPIIGRGSAAPENVIFCVEKDFVGTTIERIGLRVDGFTLPGFPGQRFLNATLLIEGTGTPNACPLEVSIDIKPGSFPNSINLGSNGTVPVAILSHTNFDARTVDPQTVSLAGAQIRLTGKGTPMTSSVDVNGDGLLDLLVHVNTNALELTATDTQAQLNGKTFGGKSIKGTDSVRVVP